jgi:branched-chain amino acid transport system substrate-binding protein
VSKGVAAVLFNVAGAPAFAKTVAAANIPIFAFASADATLLGDKTAFVLSNPIQSVAAFPGSVAKKNGFTKAAIIVIDVPGATGPAKAIGIPSLQAVGVAKPDIVNIAPGVADMSPQIQAELKNDPQLVHIIGNASFCTSAVKALRDASYKGTITMISNCVDASTIKTLGAQLKGILVSYAAGEDHNSADFKLFEAILAKYAQGQTITHGGTPMGAFAVWIGFNKAMAAATGDITPASIVSTLQAAPALPLPTIDGATFQCNGKAVTGIPAACTAAFAVATLDENGKPGGFSAG